MVYDLHAVKLYKFLLIGQLSFMENCLQELYLRSAETIEQSGLPPEILAPLHMTEGHSMIEIIYQLKVLGINETLKEMNFYTEHLTTQT